MKKPALPSPSPAADDDPTPAYTGPAYPDYNALAIRAQSPGQQDGSCYIRSLADIQRLTPGAGFVGGFIVPVTTLNSDGSVNPSLTIQINGDCFIMARSNAAFLTSVAGVRFKKNGQLLTDWLSLLQVINNQEVVGKPISPFAGPDDSYLVSRQRVATSAPYNFRIKIKFDTIEFFSLTSPFTMNAYVSSGDAGVDFF